jgi:hypothetical protein
MTENIWFKDFTGFVDYNNLSNFFPSHDQTFEEKLNSSLRFTIYVSLVLFLLNRNNSIFYAIVLVSLVTFILYEHHNNNSKRVYDKYMNDDENNSRVSCSKPKPLNPFMNILMNEYVENPEKPRACDVSKDSIKSKMKTYFSNDLYENIDDVFNKNSSYRQFYTTPSTTIPNDQESFAKWLYYNEDKTCKEGNMSNCY